MKRRDELNMELM
jgi:hypothetical protein